MIVFWHVRCFRFRSFINERAVSVLFFETLGANARKINENFADGPGLYAYYYYREDSIRRSTVCMRSARKRRWDVLRFGTFTERGKNRNVFLVPPVTNDRRNDALGINRRGKRRDDRFVVNSRRTVVRL